MEGCVTQQSGILEVCRNHHHVGKRQKRGGIDTTIHPSYTSAFIWSWRKDKGGASTFLQQQDFVHESTNLVFDSVREPW